MNMLFKSIAMMLLVHAYLHQSIVAHTYSKTMPITVPEFIDGLRPIGINGHEVEKLLYIRKQIETLVYGALQKDSHVRVGKYMICETSYTIEMLAALEQDGILEVDGIAIHSLLEQVKKDFMDIARPFVEQARGVKGITLKFIEEWSVKHHKEQSYLLDWSKEEDGKELEFFTKHVNSFRQLHAFCVDLISFITDLIQSCPKAWAQYKELKNKRALQKSS